MDNKSHLMLVKDASKVEVELKEKKDLFVSCKRTKISGSIVQLQQGVEISDKENKMHESDALVHKVSAGKDPMNGLTGSAVKSNGEANGGCTKGRPLGVSFTGTESASSRLPKICTASGWNGPLYDFEEQGPPHNKLFTCKVTVHVDGIVKTVIECFGGPKSQKKAAQEHAAQGALWCLAHLGHVK